MSAAPDPETSGRDPVGLGARRLKSGPRRTGALRYRPEIDGLRCIAVLSVILYHAGLDAFSGGFIGVDIFFVISGYLITSIIDPEIRDRRFTFAAFYERRARRIFPALFLMAVSTSVAAYLVLAPDQLQQFGQSLVAVSLFVSNRFFFQETGYFAPDVREVPLLHMWSLSIEEQFYVVFPLCLLAVARWRPNMIRVVLGVALALSFALCVWRQLEGQAELAFFGTASRVWELLLGAWLAVDASERPPGRAKTHWAAAGLLLTVVPVVAFSSDSGHPGWLTLIPVLGAGLLLRHATADNRVGALLAARPLVGIGLVSYGAYLWHQPVFAMTLHVTGAHPAPALQLVIIAAILGVAYLSWRFVEMPLRNRSVVGSRRIWLGAGLGSAVLLTAGFVANISDGLPERFAADFRPFQPIKLPSEHAHCLSLFPGYSANCLASVNVRQGEPVDWLIVGDSHAQAFAAGIIARHPDLRVVSIGRDGCLPFVGVERVDGERKANCGEAFDRLTSSTLVALHTVLVGRYPYYAEASRFGAVEETGRRRREVTIQPTGSAGPGPVSGYPAVIAAGLAATLDRAKGTTQMYFLHSPPELGFDPRRCLPLGLRLRSDEGCRVARAEVMARQRSYRAAVQPVLSRHPEVTVIDPMDLLCRADACTALVAGNMMYRDDDHLSLDGAAAVFDGLVAGAAAGATP